jgi:arsenite methyltransferase
MSAAPSRPALDPASEPRSAPDPEAAVRDRYSEAAQRVEPALCCPVEYDPRHLAVIPREVLERDYGCGDPSRFVREGDTVLDLGSGGGKICFIAAQIAGPAGRVIGVDVNDEMLALARRAQGQVAAALGYDNVEFRRGRIEELDLDLDVLEAWLRERPARDLATLAELEAHRETLRREAPLVPDESVDLVVSNCVLNLVREARKRRLVREIFRVLRAGGRIAISDIVCDEPVPERLRSDPALWSGCVSGAFREDELLRELEEAGFHGIRIETWAEAPFAVVEGIEFRAVTVTAHKGKQGPCVEGNQAVIYRGPWRRVEDDDGHALVRGERTAVCEKTYRLLTSAPYAHEVIPVPPRVPVPEAERTAFDCLRTSRRDPRESKGEAWRETRTPATACGPDGECC